MAESKAAPPANAEKRTPLHRWVPRGDGEVPPGAVLGGQDTDGSDLYVGRAEYQDLDLPAKICPSRGEAYVCYDGFEVSVDDYEFLVSDCVKWSYAVSTDPVPVEAVRGGFDDEGVYIGRVKYKGSLTPGKIQPKHRCLYIPFAGEEVKIEGEYEILCYKFR